MKNLFALILVLFLINHSIFPQNLLDGLIVHYPLDGNIEDASGNGHDGSFILANSDFDRFGNPNACYHFNGVNQYIEISNDPEMKPFPPFTVSLWAQFEQKFDRGKGLITNDYVENKYTGFHIGTTPSYKISAVLGNGGIPVNSNRNAFITLDEYSNLGWYHIVAVYYSYTSGDLYIDGDRALTEPQINSGSLTYSSSPGRIGVVDNTGAPRDEGWFRGKIDDVAMWSRVLSQDEIYELFEYGIRYPTGISRNKNSNFINIFPNPVSAEDGLIRIKTSNLIMNEISKVLIINYLGEIIYDKIYTNNILRIENLRPGFYIMQFLNKKNEIISNINFIAN